MAYINNQYLPASGPERENLRVKGQFWTPAWVADAMVTYVLQKGTDHIFDPAVGAGVFFQSAKKISSYMHNHVKLLGTELDPDVLAQGHVFGLADSDFNLVEIRDFILDPPENNFDAIIANPPYIRHHKLPKSYKEQFLEIAQQTIGQKIDGRAGVHIYFLLQSLKLLNKDGRLSFIIPADTFEGLFANTLWKCIADHFCIEAVVSFDKDATPFPLVDTNALIVFIKNSAPKENFLWAYCKKPNTSELTAWVKDDFTDNNLADLDIYKRSISEGLSTGLSRRPRTKQTCEIPLSQFATTMRGVASGANDYFLFTKKRAKEMEIPFDFFVRTLSRTRDVNKDILTIDMLEDLDDKGIPTLLLSLDDRQYMDFPTSVKEYIKLGEEIGLHERALISTRKPWYKMEKRTVPPIIFAYLGRRNCRFILNEAGIIPLTGFLCIYPKISDREMIHNLFLSLNHPETIKNLSLVGKSYGSGAIKVEPRSLEKLPIPNDVLSEFGVQKP